MVARQCLIVIRQLEGRRVHVFWIPFPARLHLYQTELNCPDRTNKGTELATNTLALIKGWKPLVVIPTHRLVGTILTGDEAATTADTLIPVNLWVDLVVPVQLVGRHDVLVGNSDQVLEMDKSSMIR